jgi:hypothetical protein
MSGENDRIRMRHVNRAGSSPHAVPHLLLKDAPRHLKDARHIGRLNFAHIPAFRPLEMDSDFVAVKSKPSNSGEYTEIQPMRECVTVAILDK